jgi:hypothetical protein
VAIEVPDLNGICQIDSTVGISVDTCWTARVSKPGKDERFFFSIICPYRLWGPPRLICSGYRHSFFFSVKAAGAWSEPLSPYSAEVKNEWSYTSTPPACLHGVDRRQFTVDNYFFVDFFDYRILSVFLALCLTCVPTDGRTEGLSHFNRRPAR